MTTIDRLYEILEYDKNTGIFIWKVKPTQRIPVGSVAGTVTKSGYIHIMIGGSLYKAHRLAWLYCFGKWPTQQIDHINRDRSDNRICNLRDVTAQKNCHNLSRVDTKSKTGYRGVYWCEARGKYRVTIKAYKKNRHIGYFTCPNEANSAYLQARDRLQA